MTLKTLSIVGFLAVGLAGCNAVAGLPDPSVSVQDAKYMAMIPDFQVGQEFHRYQVDDTSGEAPGTVVIDSKKHFLYFVLPNKKAIRYGVATGAEAAGWSGIAYVGRKAEWPHWMPPADMLERWPNLKPTGAAGGLPGGPDNPLGARAMYLYQGNKDTLYRIHGTNEPETIGHDVSSGCIRLRNIDAIDLFNRIKVGAKVVVL
jgi:lipoprotein-anchoring transpeptidase ErfK/SrfK